jgi:hypothetical protein
MRDFRDAKTMAHALREALKGNAVEMTHSKSLELIAKTFGYDNWNILSAKIEAARPRAIDAGFARLRTGTGAAEDPLLLVLRKKPARGAEARCRSIGVHLRRVC